MTIAGSVKGLSFFSSVQAGMPAQCVGLLLQWTPWCCAEQV